MIDPSLNLSQENLRQITVTSCSNLYSFVYVSRLNAKEWKNVKNISRVSLKRVRYSKRVFQPQGTFNYEFNVSHICIAPRENTLESTMGRRHKHFLNEYVGLARFSPRTHWFLELASLAEAAFPII